MSIGEKLKEWCNRNYGSVLQASKIIEVQYPQIHRYITDEQAPGAPFLIKINKLGCDLNWLLSDTNELFEDKINANLKEENKQLKAKILVYEKKIDKIIEIAKDKG